eukprot:SAG25_NODE_277_length_10482_cov_6.715919_12_plen_179_part_00
MGEWVPRGTEPAQVPPPQPLAQPLGLRVRADLGVRRRRRGGGRGGGQGPARTHRLAGAHRCRQWWWRRRRRTGSRRRWWSGGLQTRQAPPKTVSCLTGVSLPRCCLAGRGAERRWRRRGTEHAARRTDGRDRVVDPGRGGGVAPAVAGVVVPPADRACAAAAAVRRQPPTPPAKGLWY